MLIKYWHFRATIAKVEGEHTIVLCILEEHA